MLIVSKLRSVNVHINRPIFIFIRQEAAARALIEKQSDVGFIYFSFLYVILILWYFCIAVYIRYCFGE